MAVTYSPWVPEEPQQQAPQDTGEVTYEPWTPEPVSAPQAAPRTAPQIQEAPSPGPTVFENAPGYTEQYVPEDMAPLERPDIAAFAEASWRSGVRDPAELNQLLGQMFPDAGVFNITPGQVAQLKQRDAYYEAQGQENPGNFLFTPPTEEVAPADTVLGTAADAGARSLANMANSVTGAAALATDLAGYDEVSEQLLDKYLEDSIKIQVNYPTRTYKDVDDLGEAGLYAVDILAETLPQLTGTLATGAVGSAAMQTAAQRGVSKFVKDRMEAGVSREVAEQQALAMVQKKAQQGMIAGTVGNTITQESGATMGQTYMETGERAPIMSLLAGGAAGALDALAPLRALKTLGVGQQVTDQARQKLVRRITSEAGKQFLVEGGTEAVQEFIQSLPASIINGESPFTADMMDQMIEAFIRGGTGGSVVGGVTATFQGSAATKVPEQAEEMGESKQVFVNTTQRTNARKTDVGQPAISVGKHIESITQGWTNAPDTIVVNNVEDLSKKLQEEIIGLNGESRKGFYLTDSNTVIVLSDNIESMEDVDAMYFHEALGHAGLNQEFQTELSETLTSLYSDNQIFQADVDHYMNDTGETDLAIAAEEVMAEYSEGGFVDNKGLLNRLNTWLAEFTKDLPMPEMFKKGLETQQVQAILAQAHERIQSGEYQAPQQTDSGIRFMQDRPRKPSRFHNRAKERGMAGNVNLNRIATKKGPGVYEWIQQIAEDAPEQDKFDPADIDARARAMDLGLDEIREINRLDPAVAHAVGIALVKKAERVEYLAAKIDDPEVGTDADREAFAETMLELGVIYEKYSDMANDAGKLLAAFKIAKQSSVATGVRFMRSDMETQAGMNIDKLAHEINTNKSEGVGKKVKKAMKSSNAFAEAINLPRTLMSSFDLSAPLRQGLPLIWRKEWWSSAINMFMLLPSQSRYDALMDDINNRPSIGLMKKAGLSITTPGGKDLNNREERFMSTWGEKAPLGIGMGVRASERTYVGFLNKLRADTFDNMIKEMQDMGHDVMADDAQIAKDLASFINAATGRGSLDGGFGVIDPDKVYTDPGSYSAAAEKAAPFLNGLFFSPRLIASRVTLLNPVWYGRLSKPVQAKAMKNMAATGATALSVMSLVVMAGFDVEDDPRSSDFGKIRDGTRRYDILGGFGQYITLAARLLSQEVKRTSGKVVGMNEAGSMRGGFETASDFIRNKTSPVTSFFIDMLDQENVIGEPFELHTAIVNRVTPLFLQDFYEAMSEEPTLGNALSIAPVLFGVGMSDFDSVPSDSRMLLHNDPNNAQLQELDRLRESTGKQPIAPPSGRANLEGDGLPSRTLTEEEYSRYVEIAEEKYVNRLPGIMRSTEYQNATDENKIALVREMATEARKEARAELSLELFGGDDDDVTYEEWTP